MILKAIDKDFKTIYLHLMLIKKTEKCIQIQICMYNSIDMYKKYV